LDLTNSKQSQSVTALRLVNANPTNLELRELL